MGAGGREKLCLLIHTRFASHTEKRTGIWLDAECLATLAVYVYVISSNVRSEGAYPSGKERRVFDGGVIPTYLAPMAIQGFSRCRMYVFLVTGEDEAYIGRTLFSGSGNRSQIISICHRLDGLIIVLANLCGRYRGNIIVAIAVQADHNLA
jgi:hypothetical protein